jgi:hypothetical protein
MEDTYQVSDAVQGDNAQTEQAQTLTATTVAEPNAKYDKSKNVSSAMTVTGISMVAIFGFMLVFYLVIKAIDHFFPDKTGSEIQS